MLLISLTIFTGIVILGIILAAFSPGRPMPLLDESGNPLAGSISEKLTVKINGVDQGMFIKGKNVDNPVLLFLHGGPGMPEYWLTQRYPTGLEDLFTVVWWDQRGAGLSYQPDMPAETMTVAQFTSDTLAVTNYLIDRFGQEKIYLMAHSWGSFIGLQVVSQRPELFHAYIGVAQVSNQIQSEQLAYAYALDVYKSDGKVKMVQKLEDAPPTMTVPLPDNYMALRDKYMHEIGIGTTREMKSVISGIFLPSWFFREYTLTEKLNLWRGKIFARSGDVHLWDEMLVTDLTVEINDLDLPVYFFHGQYDYTCAYPLSRDYVEKLNAPLKGFYTFYESAHSPIFEEPERVLQILQEDVLQETNNLADRK